MGNYVSNASIGSSLDAVRATEIYEFTQTLVPGIGVANALPHFQAYKLAYAYMLADMGRTSLALEYCESVDLCVKSYSKGTPYFHRTFLEILRDLQDRLSSYAGEPGSSKDKSGGKIGTGGSWLMSALDQTVNKFMNGALGVENSSEPNQVAAESDAKLVENKPSSGGVLSYFSSEQKKRNEELPIQEPEITTEFLNPPMMMNASAYSTQSIETSASYGYMQASQQSGQTGYMHQSALAGEQNFLSQPSLGNHPVATQQPVDLYGQQDPVDYIQQGQDFDTAYNSGHGYDENGYPISQQTPGQDFDQGLADENEGLGSYGQSFDQQGPDSYNELPDIYNQQMNDLPTAQEYDQQSVQTGYGDNTQTPHDGYDSQKDQHSAFDQHLYDENQGYNQQYQDYGQQAQAYNQQTHDNNQQTQGYDQQEQMYGQQAPYEQNYIQEDQEYNQRNQSYDQQQQNDGEQTLYDQNQNYNQSNQDYNQEMAYDQGGLDLQNSGNDSQNNGYHNQQSQQQGTYNQQNMDQSYDNQQDEQPISTVYGQGSFSAPGDQTSESKNLEVANASQQQFVQENLSNPENQSQGMSHQPFQPQESQNQYGYQIDESGRYTDPPRNSTYVTSIDQGNPLRAPPASSPGSYDSTTLNVRWRIYL